MKWGYGLFQWLPFFLVIFAFGKKSDFLILGNPDAFTILNHYEQPLTPQQRNIFPACVPLQILNHDKTLGDQITQALEFYFQKSVYFLVKNEDGKFISRDTSGHINVFRDCLLLGDTVEIIGNVCINRPAAMSKKCFEPAPGDALVKIFLYKDQFYLMHLGQTVTCGWCAREAERWFKKTTAGAVDVEALSVAMRGRLLERIESANREYRDYFGALNKITGQQRSVPQWVPDTTSGIFRWLLSAPPDAASQLSSSTSVLVRELESMILGKHLSICTRPNEIIIQTMEKP